MAISDINLLRARGHTGGFSDMLQSYLFDLTALPSKDITDMYYKQLIDLGFSGARSDMWAAHRDISPDGILYNLDPTIQGFFTSDSKEFFTSDNQKFEVQA